MAVRVTDMQLAILTSGVASSARVTTLNLGILTDGVASFARVTVLNLAILASGVSYARVTGIYLGVLAQRPLSTAVRPMTCVIG